MFKILPKVDLASRKLSISFEGEFTDEHADAFREFTSVYEVDNLIMDRDRNPPLTPKDQRVCRFCDKSMPDVTFRKVAHSLPQLMGNRHIVSDEECDVCNAFFSKYESELASFMGLSRTLSFLKGQGGIPKYKSPDKNLTIGEDEEEKAARRLKLVSIGLENDHYEVNEAEQTVTIKGVKHPYTPLKVCKLLLKVGYSLLPSAELPKFKSLRKLLMSDEYDEKLNGHPLFRLFGTLSPGPPFPSPLIFCCKKKADQATAPAPSWCYVIYFQNYIYQFFLPYYEDDRWMYHSGNTVRLLRMPPFLDKGWIDTFGNPTSFNLDLSSYLVRKNEPQNVTMQFQGSVTYFDLATENPDEPAIENPDEPTAAATGQEPD